MIPDKEFQEKGIVITTGSTLRAERVDRPLAYRLKSVIDKASEMGPHEHLVAVISDIWYLNCEALQHLPLISVGGPGVNAVSAHLCKKIPNILKIDETLLIQMDPHLEDLRVCLWGMNHESTSDALDLFVNRNYLSNYLDAVMARAT